MSNFACEICEDFHLPECECRGGQASCSHGRARSPVVHEIKSWPRYFEGVWEGTKPFEVRKNDRDYRVGDRILQREWTPETERYTGREVLSDVTYVLDDSASGGLTKGYVVLGIRNLGRADRGRS